MQNNQPSIFGISLGFICQRMHICVRCPARSNVQTNSHKYLWIFGRGDAKHRHRKARANTLFVIGRNIDGSVMDLRRFYLIISPVQTIPLWSKTTPKVTSVTRCCFGNWKWWKHQQSHNGSRPMCLMKIELETKVWIDKKVCAFHATPINSFQLHSQCSDNDFHPFHEMVGDK